MTSIKRKISWPQWALAIVAFIFVSIIKLHNYDRYPTPAHGEELLYSWSGIHLIETGVPVSWSTLDYPKENLVFDGIVGDKSNLYMPAKLWRPWLDEPPLYSLLSGGAGHIYGDDRTKIIPPSHSRIPSVFASIIASLLVFWTGFSFWGYGVGVLAMLFYGLSPILVFGSRLSVPENIIAMVSMAAMIMVKSYLKKPRLMYPIVWGMMAAVLGLMKPTGFFLAPLMMFLTVTKKRWSHSAVILGLTLLGVAAFIAYGYYYDWDLFVRIVGIQGQRFAGWSGLSFIFNTPAYDISLMFDGWYIFGLFFALVYSLKRKKGTGLWLMSLFFFYWLLVATLSGTEQDLLPWYRYPLFPLIAIFGALGIRKLYRRGDFFSVVLILGLLLTSRFFLANEFRPTTPPNMFRLIFFLSAVPGLVYMAFRKRWGVTISRAIIITVVVLGLFLNARYIYSVFEIRCESKECPFGPSTVFSEVRLPFLWRLLTPGDSIDMLTTRRPWL